MWQQDYTPIAGSIGWSAVAASLPMWVLFFFLAVWRKRAWISAVASLVTGVLVAGQVYCMPPVRVFSAVLYGAAFGLLPIGWITFSAILLYRLTVKTGQFEVIKRSLSRLTSDPRLQALLIAFAFGGFIEGAAGSGVPVAVGAAMLAGMGFDRFQAAGLCLLANTAPVAFAAIGTPILTLAATTGLPLDRLSADVGRICAPVSLFVPAYLTVLVAGWRGLRGALPAVLVCGFSFASVQLLVSNQIGPQTTAILASLAAMACLIVLLRVWEPRDRFYTANQIPGKLGPQDGPMAIWQAWLPYVLLAGCVLAWGLPPIRLFLGRASLPFDWPFLHNYVLRIPPVVPAAAPYAAQYNLDWLATAGTACMFASVLSAFFVGMSCREFGRVFTSTGREMLLPLLTIASVLGLAFVMNYSGATATLGLAFAATDRLFPFFSAMLGWVGVFLTGSDTSANALFGNLQVVTAKRLGLSPILMAAANSSGGVMGKMISIQSIAVAVAATGMKSSDEAKLFRFTFKHSLLLASAIGLLTTFYAYVAPGWVR